MHNLLFSYKWSGSRLWSIVLLLTPLIVVPGCSQSQLQAQSWESALYNEHPLVGAIWDSSNDTFINEAELIDVIASRRYVLLGEKHDNPDHHSLQLRIINQLIDTNLLESLSLEMIDTSSDPRLENIENRDFDGLDELKTYLEWDEEGWDWPSYGPLVMAAIESGVPVLSANISVAQVGELYGQPLDRLVEEVLDDSAIEQLTEEIDISHCNMLPASQFSAMVNIQRRRDHQMAESLVKGVDTAEIGAIRLLVAGNYHVRRDLGVPNYLQALDAEAARDEIVSLAMLEVDPSSENPMDYLQAYSETIPFDYVWFTPAISDEDYCASLQQ